MFSVELMWIFNHHRDQIQRNLAEMELRDEAGRFKIQNKQTID